MDINLTSIYIANLMAVVLVCMTIADNRWRIIEDKIENKCIHLMLATTLVGCILDPLTFTFDGKVGVVGWLFAFVGNGVLFCFNMVIGPVWSALIIHHVRGSFYKYEKRLVYILCIIGFILIVANLFVPIVYHVDSNNVYHRDSLYWYYLVMEAFFLIYGCVMYIIAKSRGGILKFFPVVVFIIPIVIGIVVQTSVYGVSTIPPFVAISVCCMINSLKNESIYKDHLTGIYNRAYLDQIKRESDKKKNGAITAIMIDLNDFKSINDRFGHNIGDQALIDTASILRKTIGDIGSVIRYAGDEFVIIINTNDEGVVDEYIEKIKINIDKFNESANREYDLLYAIGRYCVDLSVDTVDSLLNEVDHRMYLNKEAYYLENPHKNRRKR